MRSLTRALALLAAPALFALTTIPLTTTDAASAPPDGVHGARPHVPRAPSARAKSGWASSGAAGNLSLTNSGAPWDVPRPRAPDLTRGSRHSDV